MYAATVATFVFRRGTFSFRDNTFLEKSGPFAWYQPCLAADVPQSPDRLTFNEPVVLWRMRRADGLLCHAVITPRLERAVVAWYVNGRLLGYRDFDDWTSALEWSDQLQAHNQTVGWRLAPE